MSHHNHHECGCCCGKEHGNHHGSCCQHDSECCHHKGHGDEDFAHDLLEMADDAWMELLKEKIKAHIEKSGGAQLDKLAEIVSASNNERWKHKMAKHQVLENYRGKLDEFFRKK